ncbi:MAG: hypothetical protein ACYS7Y_04040 [Planctomycetota bacterium]|jgi:hypothetical protein
MSDVDRVKYAARALRIELDIILGDEPVPADVTLYDVINTAKINLSILNEYSELLSHEEMPRL